VSAVRRKSKKE